MLFQKLNNITKFISGIGEIFQESIILVNYPQNIKKWQISQNMDFRVIFK